MCSSGGHLLSLPGWLGTVCFSMARFTYSTVLVYYIIEASSVKREKANSFQIDHVNFGPSIPESIKTEKIQVHGAILYCLHISKVKLLVYRNLKRSNMMLYTLYRPYGVNV